MSKKRLQDKKTKRDPVILYPKGPAVVYEDRSVVFPKGPAVVYEDPVVLVPKAKTVSLEVKKVEQPPRQLTLDIVSSPVLRDAKPEQLADQLLVRQQSEDPDEVFAEAFRVLADAADARERRRQNSDEVTVGVSRRVILRELVESYGAERIAQWLEDLDE